MSKGKKTQFEEKNQASELDMEGMLKLSNWKCKTTIINMPRAPMDTVDSIQEPIINVSREKELKGNTRDQK